MGSDGDSFDSGATVVQVHIEHPQDLSIARRAIGKLSTDLGFSSMDRVQICTAVSEIVRNVLLYAGQGELTARKTTRGLLVHVTDDGPGIPLETIAAVEAGTYESKTGLGKGLIGAKKLMDHFSMLSVGVGTQVFMEKELRATRHKEDRSWGRRAGSTDGSAGDVSLSSSHRRDGER